MPNTYTQLHIQLVFAVKYRASVIHPEWKDHLYRYMTGIIQQRGHKMLAINGMPDRIHVFVGWQPNESISDMMKWLKGDSSEWLNQQGYLKQKFRWQEGYGAFSYSHSHIDRVVQYIYNQEKHHAKQTFLQEYKKLLEKFEVPYDEKYIFKPLE